MIRTKREQIVNMYSVTNMSQFKKSENKVPQTVYICGLYDIINL